MSAVRLPTVIALLLTILVSGIVGYEVLYPIWATDRALTNAKQSLQIYDFDSAERHLLRVLEIRSDHAETAYLMAQICRRKERYSEAHKYLTRAQNLQWVPEYLEMEHLLLTVLEKGPAGPAEAKIRLYIDASHPEDRILMEGLAKAYLDSHFLNEAKGVYDRWIERYPDDWYPHFQRGLVKEAMLDGEGALKDYRAVLQQHPDHPTVRRMIAAVYVAARRELSEGVRLAEEQLRLHPDDPETPYWLAEGQQALGQPEAALQSVNIALERSPNLHRALVLKASLLRDKDLNAAIELLLRAERVRPDYPRTAFLLSQIAVDLGRTDDAKKYAARYQVLDLEDKRQQELATAIRGSPQDPDIRYQIGKSLLSVGREKEALGWFLSALRHDPRHQDSQRALAEYSRAQGNEAVQPLKPESMLQKAKIPASPTAR